MARPLQCSPCVASADRLTRRGLNGGNLSDRRFRPAFGPPSGRDRDGRCSPPLGMEAASQDEGLASESRNLARFRDRLLRRRARAERCVTEPDSAPVLRQTYETCTLLISEASHAVSELTLFETGRGHRGSDREGLGSIQRERVSFRDHVIRWRKRKSPARRSDGPQHEMAKNHYLILT